ncbi:MAG: PilZ domain-containing protein, partial [Pseudomonadota bacterium]|nr:PilZ domain-containing protein [Pseudomonadota bacterium]
VLNISQTGFMARSEGRFEVGSRVWLILPGRERANAVVKWTAGDKLGAEFTEPIEIDGLPS